MPKFRDDRDNLLSYRRRIDTLTPGMIEWLLFGPQDELTSRSTYSGLLRFMHLIEPYQPDRCLRQFGYLQVIPQSMHAPSYAYRPTSGLHYTVEYARYSDHHWDAWVDHRVFLTYRSRPCTDFVRDICQDYLAWYLRHSHPRITRPSSTDHRVTAADDDHLYVEVERSLAEMLMPVLEARTVEERNRYFDRNRCGLLELAQQLLSCERDHGRGRGQGRGRGDVVGTQRTASIERTVSESETEYETE